jgi:hypothetical protein
LEADRALAAGDQAPLATRRPGARAFAEDARTANTTRAYEADVAHSRAWARAHGAAGLPATPETVALYVADLAAHAKAATIDRRLVAINGPPHRRLRLADLACDRAGHPVRRAPLPLHRTSAERGPDDRAVCVRWCAKRSAGTSARAARSRARTRRLRWRIAPLRPRPRHRRGSRLLGRGRLITMRPSIGYAFAAVLRT